MADLEKIELLKSTLNDSMRQYTHNYDYRQNPRIKNKNGVLKIRRRASKFFKTDYILALEGKFAPMESGLNEELIAYFETCEERRKRYNQDRRRGCSTNNTYFKDRTGRDFSMLRDISVGREPSILSFDFFKQNQEQESSEDDIIILGIDEEDNDREMSVLGNNFKRRKMNNEVQGSNEVLINFVQAECERANAEQTPMSDPGLKESMENKLSPSSVDNSAISPESVENLPASGGITAFISNTTPLQEQMQKEYNDASTQTDNSMTEMDLLKYQEESETTFLFVGTLLKNAREFSHYPKVMCKFLETAINHLEHRQ